MEEKSPQVLAYVSASPETDIQYHHLEEEGDARAATRDSINQLGSDVFSFNFRGNRKFTVSGDLNLPYDVFVSDAFQPTHVCLYTQKWRHLTDVYLYVS